MPGPVAPRVVQAADFEHALRTKPCARTPHFLLHHVRAAERLPRTRSVPGSGELSTATLANGPSPVDSSLLTAAAQADAPGLAESADRLAGSTVARPAELGLVVPKRFARRAVTRNLIRRQARALWGNCADELAHGHWVVRLRSAFDPAVFLSAASPALKAAVRQELLQLLQAGAKSTARHASR